MSVEFLLMEILRLSHLSGIIDEIAESAGSAYSEAGRNCELCKYRLYLQVFQQGGMTLTFLTMICSQYALHGRPSEVAEELLIKKENYDMDWQQCRNESRKFRRYCIGTFTVRQ